MTVTCCVSLFVTVTNAQIGPGPAQGATRTPIRVADVPAMKFEIAPNAGSSVVALDIGTKKFRSGTPSSSE